MFREDKGEEIGLRYRYIFLWLCGVSKLKISIQIWNKILISFVVFSFTNITFMFLWTKKNHLKVHAKNIPSSQLRTEPLILIIQNSFLCLSLKADTAGLFLLLLLMLFLMRVCLIFYLSYELFQQHAIVWIIHQAINLFFFLHYNEYVCYQFSGLNWADTKILKFHLQLLVSSSYLKFVIVDYHFVIIDLL